MVQIAPVGCRRSSVKTIVDPSGDQRAVHHGADVAGVQLVGIGPVDVGDPQ